MAKREGRKVASDEDRDSLEDVVDEMEGRLERESKEESTPGNVNDREQMTALETDDDAPA